MLKFSSKSDVNAECKCIVRLLDDSEVIECDIQVKKKKGCKRTSLPPSPPPFSIEIIKKIRRRPRRKNGEKITEISILSFFWP
jgi:hypothetical protein